MNAEVKPDPFAGKPMPPDGMLARLQFYGRRHGYVYAMLGYAGRHSLHFWKIVAPLFSRSKIRKWLQTPTPHILNLGGGSNVFDRWLTADIDPRADVYVDVTKPLLFEDNTTDVIYLEEVIEHVSCEQACSLIAECLRVLKPRGVLRLTTPDLDAFVRSFDGTSAFAHKFNEIFYEHGHEYIYSRSGVRELLTRAGFSEIRESVFRDPDSRFGHFDTHALRFTVSDAGLSQYWETEKHG